MVIGADELERRLSARLDELKGKARLKGFRPGRVPKEHLRKVFGRSVMAEVVQQAVAETSREALSQREERPAFQPTVGLAQDEAEIDKIFAGRSDLAYTLSFEVLPHIELMDFSELALKKPVAAVTDADIGKALDRLSAANLRYKAKDGAAADGDKLIIDFTGTIDGKPFEGGATANAPIVLGSGSFIPGFEEGSRARVQARTRTSSDVPGNYPEANLAASRPRFAVKVKEVGARRGLRSMTISPRASASNRSRSCARRSSERLEQERAGVSRLRLKRALLDALSEGHSFELPPTLVDDEFNAIWRR